MRQLVSVRDTTLPEGLNSSTLSLVQWLPQSDIIIRFNMLLCRNLETLLESSCEQTKGNNTSYAKTDPETQMSSSHDSVLPRINRFIRMTNHNFCRILAWLCSNVDTKVHEANELCSNSSSSLSANKVSSQLIFRLEQAITNRLLSSSLHDWKNLWFTKPDGPAKGYNLSLACPSFGASWGSD